MEAFRLLHADAPDLRAALLWAAGPDGSTDVALRFVGQLWHYWELTGDVAEQYRIAVALAEGTPNAAPAVGAPALSGTATLCWTVGRFDQAADFHRRALQAFWQAGNGKGVAWTTMCLAVQAAQSDDVETAERLAAEVLSLTEASHRARVGALVVLSRLAFYAGDHARALELSRQCAELTRPLGDRWLLGTVLTNLAESTEHAGDDDGAERLLLEAVGGAIELGAQGNMVGYLESLAAVLIAKHRIDPAIRVLSAAEASRSDRGLLLDGAERRRVDTIITKARAEAGPIRFGLAWAAGKSLTLPQAVNEVLRGRHKRARALDAPDPSRSSASVLPESVLNPAPW